MSKKFTTDVAVIGAGVFGCSIALELARLGHKVTVLDQNTHAGMGSTSFSSGILRTFYTVPASINCAWEAYQNWLDFPEYLQVAKGSAESAQLVKVREPGMIVPKTPKVAQMLQDHAIQCDRLNIPYEMLSEAEAQIRLGDRLKWDLSKTFSPVALSDPKFGEPEANSRVEGGMWLPKTGYISDPRMATQNIADAALRTGNVKFKYASTVTTIVKTKAETGRGANSSGYNISGLDFADGTHLSCPVVVNAAGPFSSGVTKLAYEPKGGEGPKNDMKITTRALRAEVATLSPPPGVNIEKDGIVSFDMDNGIYMKPEVGGKMLVGSLDPPEDVHDWVEQGDDLKNLDPTSIGDQWELCVHRCALRMPTLPIPRASESQGIVSTYDVTEDWSPIIDKSNIGGYFMAIGTSGNCFKTAPVAGRAMATIIDKTEGSSTGSWNHDETPLQLPLPYTGHVLDTAEFSRLRKVHAVADGKGVIG